MAHTFPEKLRREIQRRELAMYAIAKATGIDKGQISRFVSGERGLSIEGITEICKLLGLELVATKPAKGKRAK
jgi:transcriptional regulator with XRE-family HTH domain